MDVSFAPDSDFSGQLSPHDAFARAVEMLGGQAPTSRALDGVISQSQISRRLAERSGAPLSAVLRLERLTGIPRHVFRPDIYPAPESAPAVSA